MSYGEQSLIAEQDLSTDELAQTCQQFYSKHIEMSQNKITAIEKLTKSQSTSYLWRQERRNRNTSSIFGRICKKESLKQHKVDRQGFIGPT